MQGIANGSQTTAEEKPDLDKLYKPVGIQAVSAACCQKSKDAQQRSAKARG